MLQHIQVSNMNNKIKKASKIILLLLLLVFLSFIVTNFVTIIKYKCPFNYFLKIKCPGCGVTRMFLSVFKLDLKSAFHYNALFFISIILFIIYLSYVFISILLNKKFYKLNWNHAIIFSIILIIYGVVRNIVPINM